MKSQSSLRDSKRPPIVLVVDDNPAIRDMVSWALELDGFEPAEASEGQEALDWMNNAAREGRYPAAILLDLAMPGMDGPLFLSRLRKQWETPHPFPAIVVITAGTNSRNAESLGVDQVIVKPFHVRDLLDVLHRLT
jgi:two-component system chemotaxis response regulator CheY